MGNVRKAQEQLPRQALRLLAFFHINSLTRFLTLTRSPPLSVTLSRTHARISALWRSPSHHAWIMTMPTPPAQAGDNATQITKPVDWSFYMVGASIGVVDMLRSRYRSEDEAKLGILDGLNYLEVTGQYSWPQFIKHGYNFAQVMRLRRALVHDVYLALEKSGHVSVDPLAKYPSESDTESGIPQSAQKRAASVESGLIFKRVCRGIA